MVMNIIDVEVNKRLVEELRQCREQLAAEAAEAALMPLRRVAEAARKLTSLICLCVNDGEDGWLHIDSFNKELNDTEDALAALDAAQGQGQEERDDGREP